ncbi:carboxylesterase/lipase family protein [Niveispirillum irakense]|uniref:carboxylesterase/lipase family protein n=1 Tax=Niveispirillum irakense TaxID=34011 RepID=UPI0004103908|nr:carboxylesterase/lipase family protein [Niveispirillum irakense]
MERRLVLGMMGAVGAGLLLPRAAFAASRPVAATAHGKVRGLTDTNGIHHFKGIRYGADTAPRRFMPPLPPQPWKGIAEAVTYGAASPQSSRETPVSEDCLFLNVWTPGLGAGAKRPVMVYIHGGAYANGSGSSPLYDGARLARRGEVVVVTLNHRLNLWGYLYLARLGGLEDERFADSGNAGQHDLILALRWVRDNIAAFGGDPGNVMLFGQSGGGAKIATLMAMPEARGLFHKAATMSGQQVTASGPRNATARTAAFLATLGLMADKAGAEAVRAVPVERLLTGLKAVDPVIGSGGVYMGPVLDGRGLPRHPFYPDAPDLSRGIPMIIGNTHDETRNLIGGGDPSTFALDWESLPAKLFPAMRVDIAPEPVIAEYRRLYPHYSPSDVFFAATTAGRSWRGAVLELEARARQPAGAAPTWAYQLDWASPLEGGKWGAPHTLDIPLVFDNVAAPGALSGDGPAAQAMADIMSESFIAFARTGNPNNPRLPAWEPYDLARRQTLLMDLKPVLADDPRGAERRLFDAVPFIQQGT